MKNEKLMYSIGNIADKYIIEAQPADTQPKSSKAVTPFRRPALLAALIAVFLLLCAFTVYFLVGDLWIQRPSQDPIETVRSAIANQIGKDYAVSVEVESVEIDEAETSRVIERFISGVIAERRGWTDEYLAERFIVVKAVYYAEYDHTKTYRADGDIIQFFYLTQDIKSGKWTIIDNSGNVNWSDDITEDSDAAVDNRSNEPGLGSEAETSGVQEQIMSYLSEKFTGAYSPYYDGLHYKISGYEETILDHKCTATFLWTMYNLGKPWDVSGGEGVEQEGNLFLQVSATLTNDGRLDLDTISILADTSAVGPPNYCKPVEDFFPDQLTN